ncbi:MAG TPA: hypothetical protein EYP18_11335 [Desulfobacterales bacterium]|nr:hypothetical protein [Desulfobacterales bacterium]
MKLVINKNYLTAFLGIVFCFFQANPAVAISEQQLVVLGAAKNIEYVGQQITKAYFYKHQGIRTANARKDLEKGMAELDADINKLEASVLDEEDKNVLLFITYTRDELKEILSQPYSEENGALMLDFSESLLEGANLMASKHIHKDNVEQSMLVVVKQMEFLLERINKYYIAHKAGFKDHNNVVQLENAIIKFETDLKKVNAYHYPTSLQSNIEKLNKFWPIAKRFYSGIEKGALPVIVMASTDNLGKQLNKLLAFHHKAATTK